MDEEVLFEAAGVTVRGTLTRPPTAGPWPGLVLVAGSGPTNRDWDSPMVPGENGSGRLLAHAMAQRGVAVVRYDKRASGETPLVGELHWNDYLEEIRGALRVLRETEGVAAEYLFVAGHSEGGFHVLRLLDDPLPEGLRGAMLLATPGRRYIDLIASQLGEGMALQGKSEAEVSAMKDELIELVEAFSAGKEITADTISDPVIRMLMGQFVGIPGFSRPIMVYSPTEAIARAPIPLLVLNGERDLQVDADADYEPLMAAATAAGRDVTGLRSPTADHVLKLEERPMGILKSIRGMVAMSYNLKDRVLDPAVVEAMASWLQQQTAR